MEKNQNKENLKKEIKCDDINYAIYKVGNWKNSYEINLIGTSNEIPITKPTTDHVILSMDEIRKASFEIDGKTVNGIVALATQLNNNYIGATGEKLDELIEKEKIEYNNIIDELNNLDLEDPNTMIDLDSDSYLIYKLEKENHVTVAKPANKFTENHHLEEIKKLQNNE